jgi:hypothetical protein
MVPAMVVMNTMERWRQLHHAKLITAALTGFSPT